MIIFYPVQDESSWFCKMMRKNIKLHTRKISVLNRPKKVTWVVSSLNFASVGCGLFSFYPRTHVEKKLHEGMRGGGGDQSDPPPSIFRSIQSIDMKRGMCNKCPVYFQLRIVTWHLISFRGNGSIEMTCLSMHRNNTFTDLSYFGQLVSKTVTS